MKRTIKLSLLLSILLSLFGCGNNSTTLDNPSSDDDRLSFTSISPVSGDTSGGTLVTITGNLFSSGTSVRFGSSSCNNIILVSESQLTCETPSAIAGSVSITLVDGAESTTVANAFTYGTSVPTFSSVTPSSYINSQSTSITITGSGFETGASVTVGGATCSSPQVNSASNITCNLPTGVSAGSHNIIITNPTLSSATGNSAFTFRVAPSLTTLRGSSAQGAFQTCQSCHGTNGGLNLADFNSLSARVTPGNPAASPLWTRMELPESNTLSMPRNQSMRPESERQALADWILDGAPNN